MTAPWDEFGLIDTCFRPLSLREPGAFSLTDDAAVLTPSAGMAWVVTADALVAGIHFFADDPPASIAKKALRVNLSDLAAMGAVPRCVFLTCALPESLSQSWLTAFSEGLSEDLDAFGVTLCGGDVVETPGPLTLSVTAMGEAEADRVLRRNGAKAGDLIVVTGTIGDAALGLDVLSGAFAAPITEADRAYLVDRYRYPQPRTELGQFLPTLAHGGLDVSDGLLADMRHLAEESGVDIVMDVSRVPLSDAAKRWVAYDKKALERVVTGGDDYELVFACAPEDYPAIAEHAHTLGVSITAIGRAVDGDGGLYRVEGTGIQRVSGAGGHRHGRGTKDGCGR